MSKKIAGIVCLVSLFCSISQAELFVKFDVATKAVIRPTEGDCFVLGFCNPNNSNLDPDYIEATQIEFNNAKQAFKKVDTVQPIGLRVIDMTQAEIDAIIAARNAALDLALRNGAKSPYIDLTQIGLTIRALADILKDEINILRTQHALPDRTLAQLKTAIQNKIDSGNVD